MYARHPKETDLIIVAILLGKRLARTLERIMPNLLNTCAV